MIIVAPTYEISFKPKSDLYSKGNEAALRATQEIASARAEALRNTVGELQDAGKGSLGEIAAELNARGILTARNAKWHRSSVANLLKRLQVT